MILEQNDATKQQPQMKEVPLTNYCKQAYCQESVSGAFHIHLVSQISL